MEKAEEIQPELNSKVQAIESKIEDFKSKSTEKLSELAQMIDSSVARISAACEAQQDQALMGIDNQLASYKKDMEYRLSRLEASGSDIDYLEKNIKTAMEEVQKRVLHTFDEFTDEQQKRHDQFANSIKNNSELLEKELSEIEQNIENLKETAIGSMSQKLQGFEENFDRDLKMRADKILEDLSEWKTSFDGKIDSLTASYQNERKDIEVQYNEDLKQKLSALMQKNDDQVARIEENLKQTENSTQRQIAELKSIVSKFSSEMTLKIEEANETSDSYLKK